MSGPAGSGAPPPMRLRDWATPAVTSRPWLLVGSDPDAPFKRALLRDLLGEFLILGHPDLLSGGVFTATVIAEDPPWDFDAIGRAAAFFLVEERLLDNSQVRARLSKLLEQGRVVSWSAAEACAPLGGLSAPTPWTSPAGLLLLLAHAGIQAVSSIAVEPEHPGRELRSLGRGRRASLADVLSLGTIRYSPLWGAAVAVA
ncbi:MAG TPA: hypothetical protein VIJ94_05690 [Caulobacteraceae bacterium]